MNVRQAQLPEGWTEKTWNEVLEIRSGRNQKEVEDSRGKFPIIGSAGTVMGYANDYICEEGTTIVGRKGTINNPMLIEEKFWNVDTAFGLHAKDGLNKRFLHYFCIGFDFTKMDRGSGRPSLVKSDLLKIKMLVPPLPEQQRIVSILDKAFAVIDKAKANAERCLSLSKDLFESYLQGVFEKKGDGWEEKKLGEISKISYGYTAKASFEEKGPKFLRITDIQENGVDWETVPYCNCSDKDLPKYKLKTGDIVFARTGATTGKSYLIKSPPNAVFASYLIRLKMHSIDEFIPEFISYFFQTKTYWDKITSGISGSAQGGFNATKLGQLEFDFPKSNEEQQTIVHQLDALRAETQKLNAVYQKKMSDLEELKKSVLQKAFAGELETEKAVVV